MTEHKAEAGVIGVTDEGCPIVTEDYCCAHWKGAAEGLSAVHECWYCKYADFRKRVDLTIYRSVCRCPENRAEITRGSGNEDTEE